MNLLQNFHLVVIELLYRGRRAVPLQTILVPAADPGGGFVGFGRTPLRPGVVVENARTACSEAVPFPLCDV